MGAQILIAEDELQLRQLLAERLRDDGLTVHEAGDGVEGLAVLQANPGITLVLTDVRMPNMDGTAMVEEALTLNPELKVVLMTGYAAQTPGAAALRAREIRILVKPFEPARLQELVTQMLARP